MSLGPHSHLLDVPLIVPRWRPNLQHSKLWGTLIQIEAFKTPTCTAHFFDQPVTNHAWQDWANSAVSLSKKQIQDAFQQDQCPLS